MREHQTLSRNGARGCSDGVGDQEVKASLTITYQASEKSDIVLMWKGDVAKRSNEVRSEGGLTDDAGIEGRMGRRDEIDELKE